MMKDAVTGELCLWTIYEKPRDWPDKFVARMFVGDKPTATALHGETLDEVRGLILRLYPGLYCIPRNPRDDPAIVETWL